MVAASAGHSGLRLERSSPTAGGALSPVGQSPGQARALVVVLREESGRSRGPRRPEFPKTGRDDSAHLPRLARPGPRRPPCFLLVAAGKCGAHVCLCPGPWRWRVRIRGCGVLAEVGQPAIRFPSVCLVPRLRTSVLLVKVEAGLLGLGLARALPSAPGSAGPRRLADAREAAPRGPKTPAERPWRLFLPAREQTSGPSFYLPVT